MAFTGDKLVAVDSSSDTQDTSGTTTSTSYTATLTGGTACGFAFIAPPSGKVNIHHAAYFFNSGAGFTFVTIRVRTGGTVGSGSDVLAVADNRCIATSGVSSQGRSYQLAGLTDGNTYNVQQLYKVDSGTGTILFKHLIAEPQP